MSFPKPLSGRAALILQQLIHGLAAPGDGESARTIGGPRGQAIMPVSVERIADREFSIAHYYEQNGDLMADPEMVFLRSVDGSSFFPLHFQQDNTGSYRVGMSIEADGKIRWNAREQADQVSFANQWLTNIKQQQADWFELTALQFQRMRETGRAS